MSKRKDESLLSHSLTHSPLLAMPTINGTGDCRISFQTVGRTGMNGHCQTRGFNIGIIDKLQRERKRERETVREREREREKNK
jgi:hypothetical protein